MAALRQIPELCAELHGLGYVERDSRPRLDLNGRVKLAPDGVAFPADPVAHVLPSGPLNGSKSAPRVSGSPDARVPIRIDPTDLLARSRPASLAVAVSGAHAQDQVGHLAVATELEFWARDWAALRHESVPLPLVPILCSWLLDRLDWACQHHYAIDEFAEKLRKLRSTLTAAAGRFDAPPETLSAPCPDCHMLTLYRDVDIERVACGTCARLLTEDGYAEYAQRLIKENPS